MKRIIKVITIIGVVIAGLIIFASVFSVIIRRANDKTAASVATMLQHTPLPEGTEYVDKASVAGRLSGNGNGMQYLGAILLKSELSASELCAYYSDALDDEWVSAVEGTKVELNNTYELFDVEGGDGYFVVYTWGDGNPVFEALDLRGH